MVLTHRCNTEKMWANLKVVLPIIAHCVAVNMILSIIFRRYHNIRNAYLKRILKMHVCKVELQNKLERLGTKINRRFNHKCSLSHIGIVVTQMYRLIFCFRRVRFKEKIFFFILMRVVQRELGKKVEVLKLGFYTAKFLIAVKCQWVFHISAQYFSGIYDNSIYTNSTLQRSCKYCHQEKKFPS